MHLAGAVDGGDETPSKYVTYNGMSSVAIINVSAYFVLK